MGTGDLCRVPPAAVHPRRARQCPGTGPCGYCRRVMWVPGPQGQYSGKICFIEKPGVQDEGRLHVTKRSSDPGVAYPEVNVQVRDLERVVGIVAHFAPRGFSFRFVHPSGILPVEGEQIIMLPSHKGTDCFIMPFLQSAEKTE